MGPPCDAMDGKQKSAAVNRRKVHLDIEHQNRNNISPMSETFLRLRFLADTAENTRVLKSGNSRCWVSTMQTGQTKFLHCYVGTTGADRRGFRYSSFCTETSSLPS